MIKLFVFLRLICLTLEGIGLLPDFTFYTETNTWNTVNSAFGIFTKLTPLGAKFYNYQELGVDIFYFLNSGLNDANQLFYLHYLEISVSKDQLIHHILFFQDGNWLQNEIAFGKFDYEGKWFHQYVYFDGTTKEIVVGMIWGNNIKKEFRKSYQTLINVKITSNYGGEFHDMHPITKQQVNYQFFPGSIQKSTLTSISRVNNFKALGFDSFTCSTTFLKQQDAIQIQNPSQYQLYMIDKKNYYYYKIQFWTKVQDSYNNEIDQRIHITRVAANRFIDVFNATGSNSFILDYIYDYQLQQWFLDIKYYSYSIPIIMQFSNDLDPFENHQKIQIQDFKFISSWHLITIEYTGTQLNFDVQNRQFNFHLTQNFQQVYQFSAIYYRLFMGGWLDSQSSIDRSFALIYFYDCANIQETICHYSCQSCFGPLANQCLSCPTNSFRQLNEQSHTCICQLWYTEQSGQSCTFATSDTAIDIVKISDLDLKQCQFGYFQYENECFKCPSASQSHYISCTECLMRPKDWIYSKAYCMDIYYQQINDPQSAYVKKSLQSTISNIQYLFQNGNLIPCNGCLICQKNQESNCFFSNYLHLNQPTYIKCQQGYIFNDGLCQQQDNLQPITDQCSNQCQLCRNQKCISCKDSKLYFLDFQGKCQLCSIPLCKFCFQYNQLNLTSNSIFKSQITEFLNFNDYQIGCAMCSEYYHFSFELNQCIRNNLVLEDCQYYTIDGIKQCYSTQLAQQTNQYQQISNCQNYLPHCQNCIRDQFQVLLCITCDSGFYIDSINGFCKSCQQIFQSNVKTCNSETTDNSGYKIELAGFTQFLAQKYQDLKSYINQLSIVRANECIDGNILDSKNNQCISSCNNCADCGFVDTTLQCVKCDASNEDINYYSQLDGTCFKCPYPCKFCLPLDSDQIFEYNPYFIQSETNKYQTYKCLKNYNPDLTYIHQQSGLLKPILNSDPSEFRISSKGSVSEIMNNFSILLQKSVAQIILRNIDYSCTILSQVYSLNNCTTLSFDVLNLNLNQEQTLYTNQTDVLIYKQYYYKGANPMFRFDSTYGIRIQIYNQILLQSKNNNLFVFSNVKKLEISNITIMNTILTDQFIFLINSFYQPTNITISNIMLMNCIFENSTFIQFLDGNYNNFSIKNITIINCTFVSSSFLKQQKDTLNDKYTIIDVTITNSIFQNSQIIFIPQSQETIIKNFVVQKNSFFNTTLIQSSSTIQMNDFFIINNNLTSNILLNLKFHKLNQVIQIMNFTAKQLILSSSIIVQVHPAQSSGFGQFIMENVQLQEILQIMATETLNQDYFIQSQKTSIDLSNVSIQMLEMFSLLKTEEASIVQLTNIYGNQSQTSQSLDNSQHTFIFISNCQSLFLKNLTFNNLTTVNHPLIYIQVFNYNVNEIILEELKLFNHINFNQIKSLSSIIFISIDNTCLIRVLNSQFRNIRAFYNVSSSDIETSSLIKIKSSKSSVLLQNVLFQNNSNLNSSETQIYFVATTILLDKVNVNSINALSEIKSLSGFGVFQGEIIQITNSTFTDINSILYGIFYMELRFSGQLFFKNCTFTNSNNRQSIAQKGGVAAISGQKSSIKLIMQDLRIENITTLLLAAFIYIIPSQISNYVLLDNIFIKSLNSADNTFANFGFSQSLNYIDIRNVFINNSETSYLSHSINNMKGFLTSIQSDMFIDNFTYIGDLQQPLFSFDLMKRVVLNQIKLINITLSFSQSYLISLEIQQTTYLSDITIQNVSTLNIQNNLILFSNKLNSRIIIFNLKLQMIQCPGCQNGLIKFEGSTASQQKIECINFLIQANDCGTNSCLMSSYNFIKMKNFLIINNRAQSLGLFQINYGKLVLSYVLFKQNTVTGNGGALYLKECQITVSNVYLINNTAQIGGAVYYADGKFDKEQISQLYLFENTGTVGNNNVRENPDFLQLQIYSTLLKNKQQKISQLTIESPSYLINYQKQRINSSFIMVSSGYSVQNSEIFNQTMDKYFNDTKIQLYQFTQLGELSFDTLTNQCFIQQYFINESLNYTPIEILSNNANQTILQFNSTNFFYSLDPLIVYLDPYLNSSYYILIDCQCDSISNKNYHFQFKIKTQKCRIGEYYKNSICYKCDPEKGYFSVEKNSLECQRMDPKKIKNLTSSSLQLQPGFWRYNTYSTQIEECQFYSNYCLGGWDANYNSCSLGYIGALCEECDTYNIRGDSQFVKSISGYCLQKIVTGESIMALLLVMLILFFITYVVTKNQGAAYQKYKKLKMSSSYYKILFKYSVDLMNPLIKQSISILQILYLLLPSQVLVANYSQIIWPLGNPSKIVLHFIDFFADRIPISNIYAKALGSILLPIAQIVLFIIAFRTHRRASNLRQIDFLILFLFTYSMPNIIEQLASLIASRNITVQWIGGNVSYLYFTDEHIHWLLYFIIPATIFFLLILPAYMFYSLQQELKNNSDLSKGFTGYFSTYYIEKFYYWELINIEMILILAFLSCLSDVIIKDVSVIAILYIYYSGVSYYKPFLSRRLNQVQKVAIVFSCFIASINCISYSIQSAIIIFSLLIALLFFLFMNILIGYYNKYNENFDTAREFIKRKFPTFETKCPVLQPLLKNQREIKRRVYQRFQFLRNQIRTLKLNNSRSVRTILAHFNEEPHGIIGSNIQRQDIGRLIISSPMQQSYMN